jgi:hypothetical protein
MSLERDQEGAIDIRGAIEELGLEAEGGLNNGKKIRW